MRDRLKIRSVLINDLDIFKAGAIVQCDETDFAIITIGSDPAFDGDFAERSEILFSFKLFV